MLFFPHFKLPQFLKKQQSPAEIKANIKVFDCNTLQVKKRLGQGAFDLGPSDFSRKYFQFDTNRCMVCCMLR